MCLILFSWQQHPDYPLVLAANRDEFYQRPTARAHWWEDYPEVLAGRDLKAGGTWMGVNRRAYWSAITNYREVPGFLPDAPSRGPLVADYLIESPDPEPYLADMEADAALYNGFNLLLGRRDELWYFSNRSNVPPQKLQAGLYGLSNHLLDTPWPKVQSGREALASVVQRSEIDTEALFALLQDTRQAADERLPQTGVGLEWERLLSSCFIQSHDYGTRVSTVLLQRADGSIIFEERACVPSGNAIRAEIPPITFNAI